MKTSTKAGLIAATGTGLFIAFAGGGSGGPNSDPTALPESVGAIEGSNSACPTDGLSTIQLDKGRYGGHVVLDITQCGGQSQTVELVGPNNTLDGAAETGQALAIACRAGGELAVAAVFQGSGNGVVYQGKLPEVVLGRTAITQINQDHILAGLPVENCAPNS